MAGAGSESREHRYAPTGSVSAQDPGDRVDTAERNTSATAPICVAIATSCQPSKKICQGPARCNLRAVFSVGRHRSVAQAFKPSRPHATRSEVSRGALSKRRLGLSCERCRYETVLNRIDEIHRYACSTVFGKSHVNASEAEHGFGPASRGYTEERINRKIKRILVPIGTITVSCQVILYIFRSPHNRGIGSRCARHR